MAVDAVEFTAEKYSTRTTGTLMVAIVQDGLVLDADQISTRLLSTSPRDMLVPFDLEVTDDFEVVFMYEGSGTVIVNDINVVGATTTSGNPPSPPTPPNPDGTVDLIVKSVDQNNQPITGLWVLVNGGIESQGEFTEATFTLQSGTYTLATDDYENGAGTTYTFVQWTDGVTTKSRTIELNDGGKTFTAQFNVAGNAPPPNNPPPSPDADGDGISDSQDACPTQPETVNSFEDADGCPDTAPPPNNPPPSGPGSLTVFAHRIPSEYWGTSTFTGANAAMWFVLYNSTGWIVYSGFFDENGTTVTGLNDGETYWISPTDCDECHGTSHDVVFEYWEDGSTERQRPVTTGSNSHAYYAYDPDP